MDKELRTISFGYKIDGTPICVDYWNASDGDQASNRFHFLTHAHDHSMRGLTPSWRHRIYCSSVTAKITAILQDLRSESFVVIAIRQTVVIDCDKIVGYEGKNFAVTALEANHCPGSIMFLFDGWFGRILATGAFRFEDESHFDKERLSLNEKPIDHVYLDVSNWKREKETGLVIPTRLWSMMRALEIIARRPKDEDIIVVTPECAVGQEQILVQIADNFMETIAVPSHRLRILREIQESDVFTDDAEQSRFRLINGTKGQIIRVLKDELNNGNSVTMVILATPFDLSRWESIRMSNDEKDFELKQSMHFIPYTDHSTTEELERFLRRLTIRRLHFVGGPMDEDEAAVLRRQFEKPEEMHGDQMDVNGANAIISEPRSSTADPSVGPDSIESVVTEPATQLQESTREPGDGEPFETCYADLLHDRSTEEPGTDDLNETLQNAWRLDIESCDEDVDVEEHPTQLEPEPVPDDGHEFLFNETNNMVLTEKEIDTVLTWVNAKQVSA